MAAEDANSSGDDQDSTVGDRDIVEAARQQARARNVPAGSISQRIPEIPGYKDLEEILPSGAQGRVFKATQESASRTVALKVLIGGARAPTRRRYRFEREIGIVAGFRHPNIVTLYESGTTPDGDLYFAMEYIHGMPLDQYLHVEPSLRASTGKKAVENILLLFKKICAGVNYAHQRGVIHRDLKPENIRIDSAGEPHILDFGLAKTSGPTALGIGQKLTLSRDFIGTLAYASPEQTKQDPSRVDTRSDVYSLGVILYEMLTGHFPYAVSGQMRDVLNNIATTEPKPPSSWRKRRGGTPATPTRRGGWDPHRVGRDLEIIILKALDKDPERRYGVAGELADDIGRYSAGEPIIARPPSLSYQLQKFALKNVYAATVLVLLLVSLVGFVVTVSYLYGDALQISESLKTANRELIRFQRERDLIAVSGLEKAARTIKRMGMGWVISDWWAGRIDRAKRMLSSVELAETEHRAMKFLLDETVTAEQLLAQMTPDQKPLGQFVLGLKYLKGKEWDTASKAFEICLEDGVDPWLASEARDYLAEIGKARIQARARRQQDDS